MKNMNQEDLKYQKLYNWAHTLITSGVIKSMDKFPSETSLQKKFGYSRQTVRTALQQLEEEGLITRVRGSGTYVSYEGQLIDDNRPQPLQGAPPDDIFRIELTDRIGRQSDQTVRYARFIDQLLPGPGRAERRHGTDMHQQADPAVEAGVHDMRRQFGIRNDNFVRPFRIERNLRRTVEQHVGSLHRFTQRMRVIQRRFPKFDPVVKRRNTHALQRPVQQLLPLYIAYQHPHRTPGAEQFGNEVTTHQSGSSGNRNSFVFQRIQFNCSYRFPILFFFRNRAG